MTYQEMFENLRKIFLPETTAEREQREYEEKLKARRETLDEITKEMDEETE